MWMLPLRLWGQGFAAALPARETSEVRGQVQETPLSISLKQMKLLGPRLGTDLNRVVYTLLSPIFLGPAASRKSMGGGELRLHPSFLLSTLLPQPATGGNAVWGHHVFTWGGAGWEFL